MAAISLFILATSPPQYRGNMADQILIVNKFFGGMSQAEKIGPEAAFGADSEMLDTTKDPNQLTVLPAGTKVSGSTVTGLIKWIVDGSPYDTNRYFYDENGVIYRETSGGTWSVLRSVSNSSGQGMAMIGDYLYYTQDSQIGRYGPLSGSPSFTDDWQTGLNDTSITGFAPILQYAGGFAVGHGENLGWWDGTIWDSVKLTLPSGFSIRAFTQVQEMIVGGMWSSDGAVTDSEYGYVFFWEGATTNPTYFFPTDGAPNTLGNTKNRLISVFGSSGNIYTDQEPFNLVHQIPKMTSGKYLEIFPGAMTTWKGQTYFGSAANTDSTVIKHGIYSYGAKSGLYADSLNYAAKISTGTQTGTDVRIGAVLGIGNQLYWSWKDGSSYGVDKISSTSAPAAVGKYVSLVHDDERPGFDKMCKVLEVTHKPLASGESIQIGFKADRAVAGFTNDTANSTLNSKITRYAIPAARYKEAEFQVLLNCGATAPTVTSINYLFDDLKDEGLMA